MDRRTAVRRLGLALSLPLIAPTQVQGLLEARRTLGCGEGAQRFRPAALSPPELEMVKTVADLILPPTDTPGASDVGVHEFIDLIVSEWFDQSEAERFTAGLADLDATASREHGSGFLECSHEDQHALVADLDRETDALRTQGDDGAAADTFFHSMKRLTLTGYFTSEEGAALTGRRTVPGTFEGCLAPEPVR